jgi:argininosuccinate synthase
MIKKTVIVNTPTVKEPHLQYLTVEFDDGSFVNLDEEELKNAALLAEKGCLHA